MAVLDDVIEYKEDGTTKETDNQTQAVGSEFKAVTTIYNTTDPLEEGYTPHDYVRTVSYSANGINVDVVTLDGTIYNRQIIEFDETGRPLAEQDWDSLVLDAKVVPYGGSTYKQPSLSTSIDGYTTVSGLVKLVNSANPLVPGSVIATMPAELAPEAQEMFIVGSNIGPVRVDVKQDGTIQYNGTANVTQYIAFSGIRFVSPQD